MKLKVLDAEKCVGCQSCMFACSRRFAKAGFAESCISIHSNGGMSKGFTVVVCSACKNAPCARACPTGAITQREEGGVRVNNTKCIGCKNCKEACVLGAVHWDDHENKPRICVHCGYCVNYCPYGVLGTEKEEAQNA